MNKMPNFSRFLFQKRFLCSSSIIEQTLRARGLVDKVTTDKLSESVQQATAVYCGFDPTADSLHLGNLLGIISLIHFRAHGHQPIALIGGATGSVGDPSGKNSDRVPLLPAQIEANSAIIQAQIQKIFHQALPLIEKNMPYVNTYAQRPLLFKNNINYYKNLNCLTFFVEIGRYFRVSNMLAKDSVKSRMESSEGISFTEFSYQIFQAYDFYRLYKEDGCSVQIGGSDQWGNIVAGVDLIKKVAVEKNEKSTAQGLTIPLITNAQGEKFGKTAGSAVWLDEKKTSPYECYQFFINQSDADLEKLLKLYTFLTLEEIGKILQDHNTDPGKRRGQKKLAEEVTQLLHGEDGVFQAQTVTEGLFTAKYEDLSMEQIKTIFKDAPKIRMKKGDTLNNNIVNLVTKARICHSKTDAKKVVLAGGMALNNRKIDNPEYMVTEAHLLQKCLLIFRTGKKNYTLIEVD